MTLLFSAECPEAGAFRKSTHSNPDNCVEAGQGPGVIAVRDTTDNGAGLVLRFSPAGWARFLGTLR